MAASSLPGFAPAQGTVVPFRQNRPQLLAPLSCSIMAAAKGYQRRWPVSGNEAEEDKDGS
jgi:hypothetical protein